MMKRPFLPIIVFLIITAALSSIFYAFAIVTGDQAGGHGAYPIGLMWCPAAAALLTCYLCGLPIDSLGWGWGAWRWQILSYLWPLGVCLVVYGSIYVSGLGGFPDAKTITSLRSSLHWTNASDGLVAGGWFLLLATTGIVRSMASALGEEIGWRGFLSPRMTASLGFTKGALLTGLIWAVWHFPLLLFSNYDNSTPHWFALICFVIEVLSLAVIMSWVRQRSGSLWTGAVAHASINLFNQGYFAPLTASRGWFTAYAIDESGAGLPIVLLLLAVAVWTQRNKLRPRRPNGTE